MLHDKSPLFWSQIRSIAPCFLLFFLLGIASSALALKYSPKNPTSPKGPSTSGGPRGGCNGDQTSGLTALAPIAHIGTTTVDRPTVAWFIPDSKSYPVILKLSKYGEDKEWRTVRVLTMDSQAGVMKAVLPEALDIGSVYAWQVIVDCKPGSNSAKLVDEGQIQRIEAGQNSAKSGTKADTDGAEGIWYDALSEVLARENSPSQGDFAALLNRLIEVEKPYLTSMIKTGESMKLDCKSLDWNAEQEDLCKRIAAMEKRLKNLGQLANKPQ